MTGGVTPPVPPGRRLPSRRSVALLAGLAVVSVVFPFTVWHETWFGRPLTDEELERYLHDAGKPRKIQQAMSQVADRILRADPAAKRWYARIVELARHPEARIRTMAAWVMGQDNQCQEFHQELPSLLRDADVMVRRNAALALVRFSDPSGREELVRMLEPYSVAAASDGTVSLPLRLGQEIGAGVLLARITGAPGETVEVRAPFAGRVHSVLVQEGRNVKTGEPLVTLAPEFLQVWEALRALYLVGRIEDLPQVENYIGGAPPELRRQAELTAHAIRIRSEPLPTR